MYLAQLKIRNFRGIREAELTLKRRTLLIGSNNVGKTTVLEAAALLLGRDRMVVDPNEWDFFNGWMFESDRPADDDPDDDEEQAGGKGAPGTDPPVEKAEAALVPIRIRIDGVLADLTKEERRLFCHPSRGGAVGAWDPTTATFHATKRTADQEHAVRVSFQAQFDTDEGEVVSKRFFPIDGEDPLAGDPTEPLTRRQIQAAGYYLLSATRLWKDAVRFTSSIFGSLLRQRQVHTGDQVRRIARSLEALEPKAHQAAELVDLLEGLRDTVGRFIPLSGDDPLGFEVTELSSPDVERALTLFLRGQRDDRRLPMSRHGSAAISVQILAMLVMLGTHRRQKALSFLLGLEEPELHLHPHAQRNLVTAVREDATQVLVTTHSPAITECFEPAEVCVLSSRNGELAGRYLLSHEMQPATKNRIKRWVFTKRRLFAEALMAPAVMLVEGDTEQDLLPSLMRIASDKDSLDALGCTVVECGGSGLPKFLPFFERFPGVRVVLVDGDPDGDKYAHSLRGLPPAQQPELLVLLPAGKPFERSLVHGLVDTDAERVVEHLTPACAEILVAPPTGKTVADLETFLVDSKMKKNAALRAVVAKAFDDAEVIPPVLAKLRAEVAKALATGPAAMNEVRLT